MAGDETGVLTKAFPYTQKLKLSHNQNNLILSFALPDYEQQLSQKQFQYKLDGFDKNGLKPARQKYTIPILIRALIRCE